MENKIIWAVLHQQTKETGKKLQTYKKIFKEKWPNLGYGNVEGHDQGPRKVIGFSKLDTLPSEEENQETVPL